MVLFIIGFCVCVCVGGGGGGAYTAAEEGYIYIQCRRCKGWMRSKGGLEPIYTVLISFNPFTLEANRA